MPDPPLFFSFFSRPYVSCFLSEIWGSQLVPRMLAVAPPEAALMKIACDPSAPRLLKPLAAPTPVHPTGHMNLGFAHPTSGAPGGAFAPTGAAVRMALNAALAHPAYGMPTLMPQQHRMDFSTNPDLQQYPMGRKRPRPRQRHRISHDDGHNWMKYGQKVPPRVSPPALPCDHGAGGEDFGDQSTHKALLSVLSLDMPG